MLILSPSLFPKDPRKIHTTMLIPYPPSSPPKTPEKYQNMVADVCLRFPFVFHFIPIVFHELLPFFLSFLFCPVSGVGIFKFHSLRSMPMRFLLSGGRGAATHGSFFGGASFFRGNMNRLASGQSQDSNWGEKACCAASAQNVP